METFSLDNLSLYHRDCVKWSKDNHVCIVGTKQLLIVTLPFQPLEGSTIKRAKVDFAGAPVQAEWCPEPMDGYHRLAVLSTDGTILTYAPRMNPSWNTWRCVDTMPAEATCFDWKGKDIVYGTKNGSVVLNSTVLRSRPSSIPARIKSLDTIVVAVAWDDGLVETLDSAVIVDDSTWGVGQLVTSKLFSKNNKVYIDGAVHELPVLSPITGMGAKHCGTADGHVYDIQTLKPIDLPLDHVNGLCDFPFGGFIALAGTLKGSSTLTILATDEPPRVGPDSSGLCKKWLLCQAEQGSICGKGENVANLLSSKRCSYCEQLQEHGDSRCINCGEYVYKIFEK